MREVTLRRKGKRVDVYWVPALCLLALFSLSSTSSHYVVWLLCVSPSLHLAGSLQAQGLWMARDWVWLFRVSPSSEHRAWLRCSRSLQAPLLKAGWCSISSLLWWSSDWDARGVLAGTFSESWPGPALPLAQSSSTSAVAERLFPPAAQALGGCVTVTVLAVVPGTGLCCCWTLWEHSDRSSRPAPQSLLSTQPLLFQFVKYVWHPVRVLHFLYNRLFIRLPLYNTGHLIPKSLLGVSLFRSEVRSFSFS